LGYLLISHSKIFGEEVEDWVVIVEVRYCEAGGKGEQDVHYWYKSV